MANTTNYNLKKPAYSDTADIADINSNMDIIDGQMKTNANGVSANNTSIENIEGGIAYRLGNTNTTGVTLAVGTYVYVSGNSTLADGLYKVSTAIAANYTLSSSNCTAVSGGGLNALNSDKVRFNTYDVSSYAYTNITGYNNIFDSLPNTYFGVIRIYFSGGVTGMGIAIKTTPQYGSFLIVIDYDERPIQYLISGTTKRLRRMNITEIA